MKSWLVKLGKGFSAMKREGIIRGGKKSVTAFFELFSRIGSGDILFVSSGVGDSARYRSRNQAEELRLHGFKCSVTVQDNPFLPRYSDRFKIFIFQKVIYTSTAAKMIRKIKEKGWEIIFETDDLVYDPKFLKYMEYYKNINALERVEYKNGLGGEIVKDAYVKTAVASTSFLAKKLELEGKRVFVSSNKLSNKDLDVAEEIFSKKRKHSCGEGKLDTVKIAYFSGTASHDKDFATIENVLVQILGKYDNTELYLFGSLQTSDKFAKYENKIKRSTFVPRREHLENVSSMDINLAPLEIGNPFCESRSELKFFEAGVFGVPTIAAATQTFREAIEDGVDGFVANGAEEWKKKLEKLILDQYLRKSMGEKAREKVLREYTNKNSHNEEYYSYLKSKL